MCAPGCNHDATAGLITLSIEPAVFATAMLTPSRAIRGQTGQDCTSTLNKRSFVPRHDNDSQEELRLKALPQHWYGQKRCAQWLDCFHYEDDTSEN